MTCFLAVQGFQLEKYFIFKEIAVLCENGKVFHIWTLEPPHIRLNPFDFQVIRKLIKNDLKIMWKDGTTPYSSIPLIFEMLAREFKVWQVQDRLTFDRIFPYKSLNVKIILSEKKNKPENTSQLTCIYDHENCVVAMVANAFNNSR